MTPAPEQPKGDEVSARPTHEPEPPAFSMDRRRALERIAKAATYSAPATLAVLTVSQPQCSTTC